MACPGPIDGQWRCDGLGCDVGGIHTTCKKAKEADGYTFTYTRRAKTYQQLHDHERDVRLASMPMPMSSSSSRVAKAVQAAVKRLQNSSSGS